MAGEHTSNAQLAILMEKVMDRLDHLSVEVKSLSHRINRVEKNIDVLSAALSPNVSNPATGNIFRELKEMRNVVTVMEIYSGWNRHIMLGGIEERPGEDVNRVVLRFMNERLGIEPVKTKYMSMYAYRMPRMSATDVQRPIYLKFTTVEDKDFVKAKASKRKKELATMNISVYH